MLNVNYSIFYSSENRIQQKLRVTKRDLIFSHLLKFLNMFLKYGYLLNLKTLEITLKFIIFNL